MPERTNYTVDWLFCCYTCAHNDKAEDILLCTLTHEETHPLGICDAYEEGELDDTL